MKDWKAALEARDTTPDHLSESDDSWVTDDDDDWEPDESSEDTQFSSTGRQQYFLS